MGMESRSPPPGLREANAPVPLNAAHISPGVPAAGIWATPGRVVAKLQIPFGNNPETGQPTPTPTANTPQTNTPQAAVIALATGLWDALIWSGSQTHNSRALYAWLGMAACTWLVFSSGTPLAFLGALVILVQALAF